MSTLHSHTRMKDVDATESLTVLSMVQAFPFLNDTLSQLDYILDFPVVNLLLNNAPYLIIDNVDFWTHIVGHIDGGMKSGAVLEQIDCLSCERLAGSKSCGKQK